MLKEIVNRIVEGGSWTTEELAQELNTTPELVTAMLQDLTRRGYLKSAGNACSGTCASCPLAGHCITAAPYKVWTLRQEHEPPGS